MLSLRSAVVILAFGPLVACELVVDPSIQASTGPAGTTVGNGSTNAGTTVGNGTGSSSSSRGVGSSGTSGSVGTESSTSGATGTSSTTVTHGSGSNGGHNGTSGDSGSDGTSGSTASTGSSSDVSATGTTGSSTAGSTGTTTTGSSASTGATTASTSTSSTSSTSSGPSSTTGTIASSSSSGASSATSGSGGSTSASSTSGTTGSGSTSGSSGTTGACPLGSTGTLFVTDCLENGNAGTTAAQSIAGPRIADGGSTHTTGPVTTGGLTTGAPTTGGFPQALAARTDWVPSAVPDSSYGCSGNGSCPADGTDRAWSFEPEGFCGDVVFEDTAGEDATFVQSQSTFLAWESDFTSALGSSSTAADYCQPSSWSSPTDSVGLPTPVELVELMDLGQSPVNSLFPSAFQDRQPGPYFAATNEASPSSWVVDYATGIFGPDTGGSGYGRCVQYQAGGDVAPAFSCTANPLGLLGATCTGTGSGLKYFIPADSLFSQGDVSWSAALDACEGLGNTCGSRLATYKELATLVNFTSAKTGATDIDGLSGVYWSSTASPVPSGTGTPSVMVIDFAQPTSINPPASRGSTLSTDPTKTARYVCVSGQ